MDYNDAIFQAATNQRQLNSVIKDFQFIAESRVTYLNTNLVNYMNVLYARGLHNALQGYWHASPGLIAILAAIWGVVKFIYNAVTWVVEILHIKELLQIAEVLSYVWPQFRTKMNEIYGKVSEFSASIGWGADGLAHLINAAQSGVGIVGGLFGKSTEWTNIFGAERAIHALNLISLYSDQITKDPGMLIDLAFRGASHDIQREVKSKWEQTMLWLEDTTGKATLAIQKAKDNFDMIITISVNMPEFISKHIPDFIPDTLNWLNATIDNDILPALTNINQTITEVNADLQAEREKAQALANKLLKPGDILTNIDSLELSEKLDQELKIDDVTSRLYEKETDIIYESDIPVIKGLESVRKLAALELPELPFMSLEETIRPDIIYDPSEKIVGWFVGDF